MTMMLRYDHYVNMIGEGRVADFLCSVYEQNSQQASNTFNHINRVKLFTENSALARLQDILRVWSNLTQNQSKQNSRWNFSALYLNVILN